MKEIQPIESLEGAQALLHPLRARILGLAAEPVSAVELARELGESPQNVNYHLKALEKAGLLKKVREEKKRNLTKAYYQAQAKRVWFSPKLVEQQGDDARIARDQVSLHNLLGLARELEREVVQTINRSKKGEAAASLGIRAELAFDSSEARKAFTQRYLAMLEQLTREFGAKTDAPTNEHYTAIVAVYPRAGRRAKGGGKHGG